MNFIHNYKSKCDQYWMDVEAFFNNLPPNLYRQSRLLRNNLATYFSDTGDERDLLMRIHDYPPRYLPLLLLDDYRIQDGKERQIMENYLHGALFFTFFLVYINAVMRDEDSLFDNHLIYISNRVAQEADRCLARLFHAHSPFWDYHRQFWNDYAQVILSEPGENSAAAAVVESGDVRSWIDRFAPYKVIPAGIAILSDKKEDIQNLFALFDHLHAVQCILQELFSLPNDMQKGKYTYPVLKTMEQSGVPATIQYNPQGLWFAMALLNIPAIIESDCRSHFDSAIRITKELGLNTLLDYFLQLELEVNEALERFSLSVKPSKGVKEEQIKSIHTKSTTNSSASKLTNAIEIAQEYLLSDLSFKESWEVHRRGAAHPSLFSARFPASLILEILCTHGFEMSDQVEAYFHHQIDRQFSYYDHPDLPYADADNLGAMLGLLPYTNNPDSFRSTLKVPLTWMQTSMCDSGRIPVWINRSEISSNQNIRLIGGHCGTIEARLLTNLIDYDWKKYYDLIHKSALYLLERFVMHGAKISVNYPSACCLWRIKQLLAALSRKPLLDVLQAKVELACEDYPRHISKEINSYRISPQDAAFMILAVLDSPAQEIFKQTWVDIIIKNQRSDGSWYGEPLFFVPNRGEQTTWHSSHQLTTAFCYHALRSFDKYRELHTL